MSQTNNDKPESAEVSEEKTRSYIRQLMTSAKRRYTPKDKIRIVVEGIRREVAVRDLCRREGIRTGAFYGWIKDFTEVGKKRLTHEQCLMQPSKRLKA